MSFKRDDQESKTRLNIPVELGIDTVADEE
jgi:hypothetical protein